MAPYPQMDLTPEDFERLLLWLNPDLEEAAKMYEKIRLDLIRKFASHNCRLPDRLADITFDRIAEVLPESYVGRPEPFVNRVAYYVLREYWAKEVIHVELTDDLPLIVDDDEDIEVVFACLEDCIETMSGDKQQLIRDYYRGDKATKIRQRKELADSLDLELPVLRLKALRIRKTLKGCIEECLEAKRR